MARVNKTVALTGTTGIVVDLRPDGASGTDYNEVGYLRFSFWSNTDGTPSIAIKPVVVKDGEAAPSAANFAALSPAAGAASDCTVLVATTDGTAGVLDRADHQIGVPFSKGFRSDVYSKPLATHLLVALKASGDVYLTITGE